MGKFRGLFRKPVSHILTPALGIAALLQIILGTPSGWSMSPIAGVIQGLMNKDMGTVTSNLQGIPAGLIAGVWDALPTIALTALVGVLGRIFKV